MADYKDQYESFIPYGGKKGCHEPSQPTMSDLYPPQETQNAGPKRRAAYVPVYVGGYLLGVLEWRTDGSTVHLHQASMDVSYYMSINDFTEHLPLFYGTEIEALNHFEKGNTIHG